MHRKSSTSRAGGLGLTRAQYLPTLLIAIDLGAALVCGVDGDWRKVGYWIAAGVLTYVVTF